MKITAKCPCGATFDGEDNGDPFDRGDLLMAHRRWLESHDHVPPIPAAPAPRLAEVEAAIDTYALNCRNDGMNGMWPSDDTLAARRTLLALLGPAGGAANEPAEEAKTLWRWLYAMTLTAAQLELAAENARQREAGTPKNWPAQQEWNELVSTSHSIFLRRVRDMVGISHDEFLAYVDGSKGEAFAEISDNLYQRAALSSAVPAHGAGETKNGR